MVKSTEPSLEVFRELYLRHPIGAKAVRAALLAKVGGRWSHPEKKEQDIREAGPGEADVIAFERTGTPGEPGVSLWMFEDDGGYKVSNIVPLKSGELGITGYNSALSDFVAEVVEPAQQDCGMEVVLTSAEQTIEDWTDPKTASALKSFSALANMSTGRTHPMDERRWLDFIIAAHRGGNAPDPDRVCRWLIEVEHWPEDTARDLASEYSLGLDLLKRYDSIH